jgi:hypothetical protein
VMRAGCSRLPSRSGLSIFLHIAGMRACWRPCGHLQQTPPDPAFASFPGALKRIVLTTHRPAVEGVGECAAGSDPRTHLHVHLQVHEGSTCTGLDPQAKRKADAEDGGERPGGSAPAVTEVRNLALHQERAVFWQKPCTRSLRCNTVTESIRWLAHARVQPSNVGARDPLPGVHSGSCAGRTTHGR